MSTRFKLWANSKLTYLRLLIPRFTENFAKNLGILAEHLNFAPTPGSRTVERLGNAKAAGIVLKDEDVKIALVEAACVPDLRPEA
ncbi:hypothetical protein DAEQUDRAFT_764187 [Daedalea quercina L-15889]|uniref:Uncharacterized protein n=1 Tax=Daedalea quercina L-15889 TaxID=1314783 RepID=A0A165RMA2_9APHY|nr:hypothetical protein DAEQUDRAFT_764187 [Daedalea quercina L-15889]